MPPARQRASMLATRSPSVTVATSGAVASSSQATSNRGQNLPTYESPTAPLDFESQRKLDAILADICPGNKLEENIRKAAELLQESAGEINDKLTERHDQINRRKARRERQVREGIENAEDDVQIEQQEASLQEMERKVEGMTQRMDTSLRKCIDGYAVLENLDKTIKELSRQSQTASSSGTQNIGQTQRSQQSQRRRVILDDDGNDGDNASEGNITQIPGTAQTEQSAGPVLQIPQLTPAFKDTLQKHNDRYTSLSLSTRYSQHPDYTSFKRIIHDARNPRDNAPPLPHYTTWFAAEEGRDVQPRPGETARGDGDESEEDLVVSAIKISTTCPLTLREYKDPVTSRLCSHSFERTAIMELMGRQQPPVASRSQRPPDGWRPRVQCPVPGCDKAIAASDLEHDAVLVRKIKRIQRAKADLEAGGDETIVDDVQSVDDDSADDIDAPTRPTPSMRSIKGENRSIAEGDDIEDDE